MMYVTIDVHKKEWKDNYMKIVQVKRLLLNFEEQLSEPKVNVNDL